MKGRLWRKLDDARALWAPRHREVVDRALLSCSLIFGASMIECR